jgi:hypothetical protein
MQPPPPAFFRKFAKFLKTLSKTEKSTIPCRSVIKTFKSAKLFTVWILQVTYPDRLPVVIHDGLQSAIDGAGAGVGLIRQVVLPAHVGTRLHLKEKITYRRQSKKPSV